MKTLITLVLTTLTLSPAYANNEKQYIDCKFPNPNSRDQVVVTLENAQRGLFSYTTGEEDTGEAQNTGKLNMYRIEDTKKDLAQFSAKMKTIEDGGEIIVEFFFTMPKNLILKDSSSFKAGFMTSITDIGKMPMHANDELNCTSVMR